MPYRQEPVRLLYATCSIPGVVAVVPRELVASDRHTEIILKVSEDVLKGEVREGTIRIHTASDNQPVLSVPVKLNGGIED